MILINEEEQPNGSQTKGKTEHTPWNPQKVHPTN